MPVKPRLTFNSCWREQALEFLRIQCLRRPNLSKVKLTHFVPNIMFVILSVEYIVYGKYDLKHT